MSAEIYLEFHAQASPEALIFRLKLSHVLVPRKTSLRTSADRCTFQQRRCISVDARRKKASWSDYQKQDVNLWKTRFWPSAL